MTGVATNINRYQPENPPEVPQPLEELRSYLMNEHRRIGALLDTLADGHIEVTYAAPAKLLEGMIRFADGTTWNPGQGRGLYLYSSGTWNLMSEGDWTAFTPTVTSSVGTITSLTSAIGVWRRRGRLVDHIYDVTINVNGTGAGNIFLSSPITTGSLLGVTVFAGVGREVNVVGKTLGFQANTGLAGAFVLNYDNTYPGANNHRLVGSITYPG